MLVRLRCLVELFDPDYHECIAVSSERESRRRFCQVSQRMPHTHHSLCIHHVIPSKNATPRHSLCHSIKECHTPSFIMSFHQRMPHLRHSLCHSIKECHTSVIHYVIHYVIPSKNATPPSFMSFHQSSLCLRAIG